MISNTMALLSALGVWMAIDCSNDTLVGINMFACAFWLFIGLEG